jgi:FkbM family methyltransferase
MASFLNHIKRLGFQPRTVVDVGVAYGTPQLYAAFPDAYFFLFEPVVEFEPHLKSILNSVRGEYHLCALSAKSSAGLLYITDQSDGASLAHSGVVRGDPRLRPVDTKTLDEVFSGGTPEGPILLKTDCQGGDLNVIKGATGLLERCDVVIMEVGMFRYWGGMAPDFTEIMPCLRDLGFVAYDFFDFMDRPVDGALGQLDVAFVKEKGPFRAIHEW